MAYSIDFRQKALDHYEQHGNLSQTACTFRITNRTLYQWIALKKETGSLQHRTKGGNSERIDKEELRRYKVSGCLKNKTCRQKPPPAPAAYPVSA